MHGWNNTKGNRDTFIDIQNGVYDNLYLTEMNAWIGLGYKHLVYRLAYEFNGTFMPDYFGSDTGTNADFAAAMRHLILLMKNRASQANILAEFTFNPSYINYTDTDVMNGWPGDDVIDIVDCNLYSHCYPQSKPIEIWNADGSWTGNTTSDGVAWQASVNNRIKFWNYPGATQYNQYSSGGWSALRTIAIAKAKGKPIAFSECGSGAKGSDLSVSIPNDPTWTKWFWQICQSAISQGVSIAHINIWNIYASDGQWEYSAPDTYDPQPDVALAYRKYFGDGSYSGGPTPVSGGGTVPVAGGGSSTPSVAGGGGGTTPAATTPASTTPASPIASAALTDSLGVSKTVSVPGGTYTIYSSDTGLTGNIYVYDDGTGTGTWVIAPADANLVPTINLTTNELKIKATGFTTITVDGVLKTSAATNTPTTTTPATGASSGVATVKISDGSGNNATITLDQGYRDYYTNETGLNMNIYYYLDGNPTISSSADGNIAYLLITRNGTTTTASPSLAGVATYA